MYGGLKYVQDIETDIEKWITNFNQNKTSLWQPWSIFVTNKNSCDNVQVYISAYCLNTIKSCPYV